MKADGEELWRRLTREVRPLPGRRPPPAPPEPEPAPPAEAGPPPEPASAPAAPRPAGGAGGPGGIDRRTARRLRRGELAIEASLDLHGFTRDQAHRRLCRFIAESQAAGRRLVLVVTGKGGGPGSLAPGALRRETPLWLRSPPNAERVLDLAPAQPRHGGAGALYVYLRRRRA